MVVSEQNLTFFSMADNLWSSYSDKGTIVEKQDLPSVPVLDEAKDEQAYYIYTDIMTYFTMLVGIYFPSVTGIVSSFLPPIRKRSCYKLFI